jgi:LEA14-like dessication related protein
MARMRDQISRALESGLRIRSVRATRTAPLLLLLLLTVGCFGLPNPLTRVDAPSLLLLDVRAIRSSELEQRLDLDLLVQNPNNFDVVLDGMRLELEMNGQRVAQAVSSQSVAIGRLGETRVTVQASVTMLDVARALLTLGGRDRNGSLSYRVAGDIFVVEPRSTRVSFDDSGEVLPGTSATAR